MSESRKAKLYALIIEGLKSANRGNPFWSKADAMQSLALFHNNTSRG